MNEMMALALGYETKQLPIKHIPGPEGVRGRNSDNELIREKLGWEPTIKLADGLKVTYETTDEGSGSKTVWTWEGEYLGTEEEYAEFEKWMEGKVAKYTEKAEGMAEMM